MRGALYLVLPTLVLACSEGRVRVPPVKGTVEKIDLSPATATLELAASRQFTAVATYGDGSTAEVTAMASWRSADEEIATVLNGQVTGVAAGQTVIEATLDGITGTAAVEVLPGGAIVSIQIEPETATLELGGTVQLDATATYEDGTSSVVTSRIEWVSSDPAVATVASGLVTAVAEGTARITAIDGGSGVESNEAMITVSADGPVPSAITVTPSMVQLPIGSTQQFTARASYPDGSERDITATADWSSSSPGIATVDAAGVATALAAGLTSITATHPASGIRTSVTLRVVPAAVMALRITPQTAMLGMGERLALQATAEYTDGATRDLTNAVVWSSSDSGVATVQQGNVTTVAPGSAIISAVDPTSGVSSDDSGSSATLTITTATLESLVVIPLSTAIPLGSTRQFQAMGLYSDNSSQDFSAQVMWQSSDTNVATVDAAGLATSVAAGVTTISVFDPASGMSSDDANQSATLTVTPPALVEIAVSPQSRVMIAGGTHQFTATGRFSDGSQQNITQSVTWQSSSPAVTVAAGGLATAQQAGTAVISALDPASGVSSDASNQSATITVSNATLVSIAVTPTSTTVPVAADVQLIATGTYDNGATQDLTGVVTWSSSNQTAIRVSNGAGTRGVATALAAGAATISAMEPGTGISSGPSSASLTVAGGISLTSVSVRPRTTAVNIGQTLPFAAMGTFSNGARYRVTNSVTWSSSSNAIATISNQDGSRGVATGIAVGNVNITAARGGMSGAAALQVRLGIVNGTWPGPTVEIDSSGEYGVNVGMVTFTAAEFPNGATITDVNVTIDFLKTDGSCAAPDSGNAYHRETSFRLQSATGTQVVLAPSDTWTGPNQISAVSVTFDQAAASPPSGIPMTGTFRPNGGNLDTLNGQSPIGTWILQAGDDVGSDPLCVNSYTVTITAQ